MYRTSAVLVCLGTALLAPATADSVQLQPSKDNTMFANKPDNSSALAPTVFIGPSGNGIRRGLVAFEVAGAIPAGSTIDSVTLQGQITKAGSASLSTDLFALQRLTADWGEGSSNGGVAGGQGAPATTGDATWVNRFHPGDAWTDPGGDFAAQASSATSVPAFGSVSWPSTPALVADVQSFLDDPATNHGWVVRAVDETIGGKARRLASRESGSPPTLTIEFTPPAIDGSGAVPNGESRPGDPLVVFKTEGAAIRLSWTDSCVFSDVDYEIYEGTIDGEFTEHTAIDCSTNGSTVSNVLPSPGSTYYLVVPTNLTDHGSYGVDSDDNERPPGIAQCTTSQLLSNPVCP